MTVFVFAIALVVGVFVRILKTQRVVNDFITVNGDVSLILEKIARDIRTGLNFTLTNSGGSVCGSGWFSGISFDRSSRLALVPVEYKYDSANQQVLYSDNTNTDQPLNSNQTRIDRLCFLKTQRLSNDPILITVAIGASARNAQVSNMVNIQTSISARILPSEY